MQYQCLKTTPFRWLGWKHWNEPADHYLLTINGSVVSGKVKLTPRDFQALAEYVDAAREQGSNESRS